MKKLKALAVASVLGLAVSMAQIPIKVGSLTQVAAVPANSVFLLTVPGVTNYIISAANLQAQVITWVGVSTGAVYITTNINNYTISTNLLVVDTLTVNTNLSVAGTAYINNLSVTNPPWAGVTNLIYTVGSNCTNNDTLTASNGVAVAPDWGIAVVTNGSGSKMFYTVAATNRTITVASNATIVPLDFKGTQNWYEVPTLYESAISLAITNPVAGREIWVFFGPTGPLGNCNVTLSDMSVRDIWWNLNSPTNGTTSVTWTNGTHMELCVTIRSNNIIHAVYGMYH